MQPVDRVQVARVRRAARRQGLVVRKIRRFDPLATDYGCWSLVDPRNRTAFLVPDLDALEAYITLGPDPLRRALGETGPSADDAERPVETIAPGEAPSGAVRGEGHAPARPRSVIAAEAVERMRAIGLEPLCSFPGWSYPWPCRCVSEGCLVTPSYQNVVSGNTRGCRHCSSTGRISAYRAAAEAAESGFSPETPYKTLDAPWTLRHGVCGNLVRRSLKELRKDPSCPACEP